MNIVVMAAIGSSLLLAGVFALVFWKLAASAVSVPAGEDWLEEISPDRYRPLARLLDPAEYQRLRAHPAFDPKMLRRFRMQRVSAFRGYLRTLSLDYSRVCSGIRSLMVGATQDRGDLAGVLVRQQVIFTFRFMLAQCHLSLHACGIGTVDVADLVGALDSMRLQLNSLMEAAQPAGA